MGAKNAVQGWPATARGKAARRGGRGPVPLRKLLTSVSGLARLLKLKAAESTWKQTTGAMDARRKVLGMFPNLQQGVTG